MKKIIQLNYEDRNFFHPFPTPRMKEVASAILEKFNWEIEKPVDCLTREEAKQLVGKGIAAAKRKKVRILDKD